MGIYKRNSMWHIDYYVNGKRVREGTGTANKRLAEQILNKRLTEATENKFLDIKKNKNVTFEDYGQIYLERKKSSKSYKVLSYKLGNLYKYFKGKRLYQIDSKELFKYVSSRLHVVSETTVNRELAILKGLFNEAIKDKVVFDNPVREIKLFNEEKNKRERFLSVEECSELIEACSSYLKPMVVIGLRTGMRLGEILALKWKHIHLNNRYIYIEDSKSGSGRKIPINYKLIKILTLQYENDKIKTRNNSKNNYLFCDNSGRPLHDVRFEFNKAVNKLGLNAGVTENKDKVVFHSLRHTFASHLAINGFSLLILKELLGHKTLRMVLRYSHFSDKALRTAVESLEPVTNRSQQGFSEMK